MNELLTAKDIMISKVYTFDPEDSLQKAMDTLLNSKISGAPVVDENNNVLGVISEYDCINALVQISMGELPSATVGSMMSKNVHFVNEDSRLFEIMDILRNERIRRLPVVKEGKLVGIISRPDILKAINSLTPKNPEKEKSNFLFLSSIREKFELPITHI